LQSCASELQQLELGVGNHVFISTGQLSFSFSPFYTTTAYSIARK
jgi:Zn finger protein HypA/HybF involved in hydrogenase expression